MYKVFGFPEQVKRCVPCISAKRLLEQRKLEYEFIPVAAGDRETPVLIDSVIQQITALLNVPADTKLTMPQIFDGEIYVGGFDNLREYLRGKK